MSAKWLEKICAGFIDCLLKKGYLDYARREWYIYTVEKHLLRLIILGSCFIIGVIGWGMTFCLAFMGAFLLLRRRAGGFHASTPLRCMLLTWFVLINGMYTAQWVASHISSPGVCCLAAFSVLLVLSFSSGGPVEFSPQERAANRIRAQCSAILIACIVSLSQFCSCFRVLGVYAAIGLFVAAASLLLN